MKQSNKPQFEFSEQLQNLPQIESPVDQFSAIQFKLDKKNIIRKHRMVSGLSLVFVVSVMALFFQQKSTLDDKDMLLHELMQRTIQLEQLLASETPRYSPPGSLITERIVNIESYLAKLDDDIQITRDKQIKSQLMATKLDLLGDLVLLQRQINQKPDYQKVKPYVI